MFHYSLEVFYIELLSTMSEIQWCFMVKQSSCLYLERWLVSSISKLIHRTVPDFKTGLLGFKSLGDLTAQMAEW